MEGNYMEISTVQIIAIFIAAMIVGMGSVLDEFQTHRPLIACTITGLILGDLSTGIIIGGTLEMMALGWMNIGAAMAPDAALAAMIAPILVIGGHQSIGAGIAIAMPLAAVGQVLTIFCRTIVVAFQHKADSYAEQGNLRGIDICHMTALSLQGLRVAVPTVLVAMYIGTGAVQALLDAIPPTITGGLQVAGGFIVVVGYAMVMNMMGAKYLMSFFFLGFVVAGFTAFNLVALGIIGLVCAVVYIQLNPKYAIADAAAGSADASSGNAGQ